MQRCSPCGVELLLSCRPTPRGLFVLLFALWDGEVLLAGAVGDSRDGGAIYAAAVGLQAKEGPALTLPSETSRSTAFNVSCPRCDCPAGASCGGHLWAQDIGWTRLSRLGR